MMIDDRKRNQILEMWKRGKRVSKIARELRVSANEITDVIDGLYSDIGIDATKIRDVFRYDRCY